MSQDFIQILGSVGEVENYAIQVIQGPAFGKLLPIPTRKKKKIDGKTRLNCHKIKVLTSENIC